MMKYQLTFTNTEPLVSNVVGLYDTLEEAKTAAGIGCDFLSWGKSTDKWVGEGGFAFFYTIALVDPATIKPKPEPKIHWMDRLANWIFGPIR